MNHGPLIFLGAFLAFVSAWIGLVVAPTAQLQSLLPASPDGFIEQPRAYLQAEQSGRRIYQAEGCVYCHTQQLRGGQWNADVLRGWGTRRSDPRDYIRDYPVLLGTARTGPDLLNIAARMPDAQWHYRHLYDPQLMSPGSNMSPFRHLFTVQKIAPGGPSPDRVRFDAAWVTPAQDVDANDLADALRRGGFELVEKRDGRLLGYVDAKDWQTLQRARGVAKLEPYVPEGYEILPTAQARALVAYLLSMDHTYRLDGSAVTDAVASTQSSITTQPSRITSPSLTTPSPGEAQRSSMTRPAITTQPSTSTLPANESPSVAPSQPSEAR